MSTHNDTALPDGWVISVLDPFIDSMANGVYKPNDHYCPDGTPCLRMYNIQTGSLSLHDVKRMRLTAAEIQQFGLLSDDILINRVNSRELVGKAAICRGLTEPTVFESKNIRLRLRTELIDPRYVNYFFQFTPARAHFDSTAKQTVGMATVSQPQIRSLPLPVPPLAEQQRIVAAIERLLEKVSAAREQLEQVPNTMKRFRQAVLGFACSGNLTANWRANVADQETAEQMLALCERETAEERALVRRRKRGTEGMAEPDLPDDLPASWCLKTVRGLQDCGALIDFQDGNHGELYPRVSEFGPTGVLFLTATQVFNNRVLLDQAPRLGVEKAKTLRIGFARERDVLLTHNATVGRVAVMPDGCGEVILGTSVTYYRFRPHYILPEYAAYAMQGPLWQDQLQMVMEQTTRNQVSITKQVEFFLPVPPRDEQAEIVRRVSNLFALADSIEQRAAAALHRVQSLTQSILAKAFRGELVPTEAELARREKRSYEPASELLTRIRAGAGEVQKPKQRRSHASD